jgi:NNP family nitrate/nitrite transporter-like MFS transporter
MTDIVGGQIPNAMNSALAMIPIFFIGALLVNKNCSFSALAIHAALSGLGGGAFAPSMSSISYFFPGRLKGGVHLH